MEDEYDVQYLMGALLSGASLRCQDGRIHTKLCGKVFPHGLLLNDESVVVEAKNDPTDAEG